MSELDDIFIATRILAQFCFLIRIMNPVGRLVVDERRSDRGLVCFCRRQSKILKYRNP